MTPQERQLVDDLFARLSKVEGAPRDPDASAAISQGLRNAPNALYALVQTVLVQDEALRQAHHHIEELEAAGSPEQQQPQGGFLDSMRGAIFGQNQSQNQPRGSVPNVPPPGSSSRPVWNSGQVMPQTPSPGGYGQQPGYGQQQPGYNQPYGAPQGPMGGALGGAMGGGGGGSFLGTAAAAAAGTIGGSLLLNSFRGMMGGGGSRSAFGDTTIIEENRNPWSDESRSNLARDAGVNDVGSKDDLARQDREQDAEQDREDDANSRDGFFNSNDDDTDHDSDGFDGDSDYA
jgi:hypothetical protein